MELDTQLDTQLDTPLLKRPQLNHPHIPCIMSNSVFATTAYLTAESLFNRIVPNTHIPPLELQLNPNNCICNIFASNSATIYLALLPNQINTKLYKSIWRFSKLYFTEFVHRISEVATLHFLPCYLLNNTYFIMMQVIPKVADNKNEASEYIIKNYEYYIVDGYSHRTDFMIYYSSPATLSIKVVFGMK